MRIIRNNDFGNDDHDPRLPKPLGEMVAGVPAEQIGDILGDEFTAFLAEATAAVDGAAGFPLSHDAPIEPAAPAPVKPVLRLVTADQDTPAAPVDAGPRGGVRPRLLRAGVGGSTLVLAAAGIAAWDQPATVAAPAAVYGLGWIAYLWWNAALRPPIPQVLAVIATAISRGIAAIARGTAHTLHRGVDHADQARTRHETHRTATA